MFIEITKHHFGLEEILLEFLGGVYLDDNSSYAILKTKEVLSVPDIWNPANKILTNVAHVDYSADIQDSIKKSWQQSEGYKPGDLHFPTLSPITYPKNSFLVVEIVKRAA